MNNQPQKSQKSSLPIISIVISGIVILVELGYLGRSSLALVIIGLAVSNILLGIYVLKK